MGRGLFFVGVAGAIALLAGLTWIALAPGPDVVLPDRADSPAIAEAAARDGDEDAWPPAPEAESPRNPEVEPGEERVAADAVTLPAREPVASEPAVAAPRQADPARPVRARVTKPKPRPALRPLEAATEARALRIQAETASRSEADALLEQVAELERMLAPFVGPLVEGDLDLRTTLAVLAADQALAGRFALPDEALVLDGSRWRRGDPLPEHVVLRFPPGVAVFDAEGIAEAVPAPKTILVEGAGMDATALRVPDRWQARGDTRWTFSDCTVACDSREFMRGGPVEVRLERVRVVGFDSGAGGSEMYEARGLFVAVDCRFEQGFGRSPGYSHMFEANDLFVRLDGCTFVGPFREFSRKAVVLATDCRFEWMAPGFEIQNAASVADALAATGGKLGRSTTFVDCVVASVLDKKRWPQRKLADLNPDWTPDR